MTVWLLFRVSCGVYVGFVHVVAWIIQKSFSVKYIHADSNSFVVWSHFVHLCIGH